MALVNVRLQIKGERPIGPAEYEAWIHMISYNHIQVLSHQLDNSGEKPLIDLTLALPPHIELDSIIAIGTLVTGQMLYAQADWDVPGPVPTATLRKPWYKRLFRKEKRV